jgi:PTH1 family peptidyl-tRNA hydrolase
MNLSGQSVGEVMRFYKLDSSAITVLYDEIDLAAGKIRVKTGGSAGGHNGIRSIDQHIGNDYRRVRIGVGHPGARELVHGYVLGDFTKADRDWLDPMLASVADNADMLANGDNAGFMNKVSLAVGGNVGQPKPEKAQSHIRQARSQPPQVKLPETGPMAAMLKKLLGKD